MKVQDASDAESLLARAAGGDLDAWGALLAQHAERLRRVASFRLNPRLRGRIDAADVLQDTFIAATERRGPGPPGIVSRVRKWFTRGPGR